ncbi:MAG: hypothetical protein RI883_1470 [Bacteroidota bacterium]|jgi:uncharacterized repeat protein (TIGR01451 family)
MKSTYLLLLLSCITLSVKAQYVQGDINAMPQPSMNHDFNTCSSTCNLMYAITISNSFLGDSVKIKDESSGTLYSQDINSTGANPWYVFLPVPIFNMVITDDQLSAGNANFFGPLVKVVSGLDTAHNISNFYSNFVSSPCLYGNVSGRVYVDYNADCSFNGADVPLQSINTSSYANLNSPSVSSIGAGGYSDANGMYNITVQETWMTDYSVYIPSNYQFIFPSTACSPVVYSFSTLPQSNVDFSLQCSSNVDVQCYAGSNGIIRPNIPFYLFPTVSNTGCDVASGQLKLLLDNRVVFNPILSSVPTPTISGDTLIWDYFNLTNLSSGGYWNSFFANVHLTPIPTVTIGDNLCFKVITTIPASDLNITNNVYNFCLPVVNSYDPNFKEVSPAGAGATGGIDYFDDSVLNYTIHFQNTGTAAAYNISIIDTLDANIIPSSLKIVGSSHTVTPEWIAPGVVKFNFYNIFLPDSTSNEAASHGSIRFEVKRIFPLAIGTEIRNKAEIYFDFNPAIVTNSVLNTIEYILGTSELSTNSNQIKVYPNPFKESTLFVVDAGENIPFNFTLTDVQGKIVKSIQGINESNFQLSREGIENGIYFYSISTANIVLGTGKIIIE